MTALRQAEELLPSLTRAEKAQLLQWIARDVGDAFPGPQHGLVPDEVAGVVEGHEDHDQPAQEIDRRDSCRRR